jgi:hypothetical protein
MWKKHIFKILLFLCSVSLLAVCFLISHYVHEKNQRVQIAKDHAQQETRYAAQQIDNALSELSSIAHVIAADISSGKLKRQHILERLESTLKANSNLFGIGIAFVPYINNPQIRQLSPYYVNRKEGREEPNLLQVFTIPITYLDPIKQREIITGVVFIDYLSSNIKTLMNSLKLGRTGYGFILSEKGNFIAYPIDEYVKNHQSIFNLAESYHDDVLRRLAEKAIDGESGAIDYIDQVTGQSAWIFYQFIPSTHWSMGVVFFKDILETSSLQRQLIWICIATIVFLILLSTILFRADNGNISSLWKVVSFTTILLIVGIGFLWYITQTAPFDKELSSTMIVDKVGLQQFLSAEQNSFKKPSFYVPTGIFIDSIEFLNTNNVNLSGYIWQKYTNDIHKGLSRGFILPEAKSTQIVESYYLKENNTEVIGWHFQATVLHQFDYTKYPFDKREINLRISHKDFDKDVILTPDLEAYGIINPTASPGIKREIVLSGWLALKSFFNYHSHNEDTNFGIDDYVGHHNFSQLQFTILLKREFLEPFINNVLPLVIASAILFALQMWLGKTTTFLRTLSGIFFAILLAHIRLRSGITTPEIIYIEWFYLVIYWSIIIIIISYFMFEYKVNIVYYHTGIIPKLLFWPTILVSWFVITVIIFYV